MFRRLRRGPRPLSKLTYTQHACIGAAYEAHMLSENPLNSVAEREAYEWAEGEFNRIARGHVGEADLVG